MFKKEKRYAPEKPIVRTKDMRISAETVRFVVEQAEANGYGVAAILGRIILESFQTEDPKRHLEEAVQLIQTAQDVLNKTKDG